MPFSYSWVELHGAVTHFPITLLILVCALDFGAFVFRRPAWRETSLLLLWIAVVMSPVALLSGYFTGREYARPPVGFDTHWIAAVLTSVLALALLLWRVLSRDHLSSNARVAALCVTTACAATVGYTGHMGGQMVFGDRDSGAEATPVALAPTPAPVNPKLASAAVKMESAAVKLQSATEKLATSTKPSPPTPAPTVSTANIDQAAARLERAAESFESIAERLNRIAARVPESRAPVGGASTGGRVADSSPKLAQAPQAPAKPSGKSNATARVAPRPPVAAATAAPSGASVQLISQGAALFRSEDNGCLDCHKLNGEGRNKGGDLTKIGLTRPSLDWHIEHLKDPEKMVPGSRMPAYDNLKAEELRALAAYMTSLK